MSLSHVAERARTAPSTVDPAPFCAKYGHNTWAAADVFTISTTFGILDSGVGLQIQP